MLRRAERQDSAFAAALRSVGNSSDDPAVDAQRKIDELFA